MKKIFKYFTIAGLSGMLCLSLAINADAQRGGHGGGGGGGFHGGGGGGGFHGGGGFSGGGRSFSGGGGFNGGSRGAFNGGGGFNGSSRGAFNGGGHTFSAPQGGRSFNAAPQGRSFNSAPQGRGYAGVNRGYAGVAGGRAYVGGRGYVGGRAGFGVGARVSYSGPRGFVAGRGYIGRAYIGGRYYYGPWAGHYGYFYHGGYYNSLYFGRIGLSVGYLPYGYYPFWWDNAQFYYADGYFYNYNGGQYTVVEPPVGAAITSLPANAKAININGTQYYESNGVYYLPITKDDGSVVYQVAGKDGQLTTEDQYSQDQGQYDQGGQQNNNQGGQYDQGVPPGTHPVARMGDMIQQLPADTRKITVNGQTLWVTPDDVYLKATTDGNGQRVYTVVGTPDQNPE